MSTEVARRECGSCSLCCTVLRVDALRKLGGTPCVHQRAGGGCAIHARRPEICRAYHCLWLRGGLEEADRPDRLGALLDVATRGDTPRLEIREAHRGAFDRSQRLRQIAETYRVSMPVRVTAAYDVLDTKRPSRLLLPDGEEHRTEDDRISVLREGALVSERPIPRTVRLARRLARAVATLRLRNYRR